MSEFIVDKYKDWNRKELQGGYRCKTYLLERNSKKLIYQVYIEETKYQAYKKANITNKIKQNMNNKYIPNIIEIRDFDKFSYLVTEFKEGISLEEIRKKNKKFILNDINKEFAKILSDIHSVDVGNKFGWIGVDGLYEKKKFYEYIQDEANRLISIISNKISDENIINEINKKIEEAIKIIKNMNNLKPVINWYDINPNNILINNIENKYILSGFVDPGGARIGVKEWDLAFIKMDVCKNEEEFKNLIKEYIKYKDINEEILNALSVIVEVDDIAFQIETNTILDVAYESNFENVLEKIHKYINTNKK